MSPRKFKVTNSTDANFPSRVPVASIPSADGVLVAQTINAGGVMELMPFGTGADNSTFDMRVIGWRAISGLYIPTVICELAVTLCAEVGVSGQTVVDTERFSDAISVTKGVVIAPTAPTDKAAMAIIGIDGYDLLECIFDLGTATAANCLYVTY